MTCDCPTPPASACPLAGTTGWYTTPVIRYLTEIGQAPEILESYTWPTTTRRYFDQWYQVVRDARAAMMAAADPVIGDGDPDAATALQSLWVRPAAIRRPVSRTHRSPGVPPCVDRSAPASAAARLRPRPLHET